MRTRSRQSGVAMVELVLGVFLLFGFLVFSMVFSRLLSERNRMLSANRTVAWLATHQQGGYEGSFTSQTDEGEPLCESPAFAALLREWHFCPSGKSAGMAWVIQADEVGACRWQEGLFGDANDFETALDRDEQVGAGGSVARGDVTGAGYSDTDEAGEAESAIEDGLVAGMENAIEGFLTFLTGTFHRYHANIEYAMPLAMPRKAYELFFGPMDTVEHDEDDPIVQELDPDPNEVYLVLKTDWPAGCVFPLIEEGTSTALRGLVESIQGMMGSALEKLGETLVGLYRPHNINVSLAGALTADGADLEIETPDGVASYVTLNRLQALLVYEYYDPEHELARDGDTEDLFDD